MHTALNVQRLKYHLMEAHATEFDHLARLVCMCKACRGNVKFYDRSHAASKHQGVQGYLLQPNVLVPIAEFTGYVEPEKVVAVAEKAPMTSEAAELLRKLPPLSSFGCIWKPDGTEIRPVESTVDGKKRFMCTADPACTKHFSTAQDLRVHLLEQHGYTALAVKVCGCPQCRYLRFFSDKRHAAAVHKKVAEFNADVHLVDARKLAAEVRGAGFAAVAAPPVPRAPAVVATKPPAPAYLVSADLEDATKPAPPVPRAPAVVATKPPAPAYRVSADLEDATKPAPSARRVLVDLEDGKTCTFTHTDAETVVCGLCAVALHTTKSQVLRNHVTSVHGLGVRGGERCDVVGCACGKPFADKSHLLTHVKAMSKRHGFEVNEEDVCKRRRIESYTCDADTNAVCACGEVFTVRERWDAHLSKTAGVRTYPCSTCGNLFATKSDLRKHELRHGTDRFPCELDGCEYVGPNAEALRLHQTRTARHRDEAPLPCKCTEPGCSYAAQFQCIVDTHMNTVHTDERPYVCEDPECPSLSLLLEPPAFKTAGDLRKHELNVHVLTYEVPCTVDGCGRMFKTVRHLHLHLYTVHCERTFDCEECDAKFRTKAHLLKHLVTHSVERPFACTRCPDTFRHKYCLDCHIAWVHDPTLRHLCDECSFAFTSPKRLETHKHVHSRTYTPCQSKGERQLYEALQSAKAEFLYNYMPQGYRVRYDFVLRRGTLDIALEYDGNLHYAPLNGRLQHVEAFFWQVSRDLLKTRLCRESGIPLVRITGKVPAELTYETLCLSYLRLDAMGPYDDYVDGAAFCTEFAQYLARCVRDAALPVAPSFDTNWCTSLLCALKEICAVPEAFDLDEDDAYNLADAVLTVFLRHVHALKLTCADIARAFGTACIDNCVAIARLMPELGGSPRSLKPFALVEFTPVAKTVVVPEQFCWICAGDGVQVRYSATFDGNDELLRHLNVSHGTQFLVGCKWCDAKFTCQAQRRGSAGHGATCIALDRALVSLDVMQKTSMCGLCGFAASAPFRLLHHFNESHKATFSQWATLKCDVCAHRSSTSVGALVKHYSTAHV